MDYGYSALITEVQQTNDILTETNNRLESIEDNVSLIIILIISIASLKGADMIHHLVDSCFKGRK